MHDRDDWPGALSRRQVGVLGALVAPGGCATVGREGSSTPSGAGSGATPGASPAGSGANPRQGDTLTVAMQQPATGINPATVNIAFSRYPYLAYEPLIYRNSDGKLEPGLAEKWSLANNNTEFTVNLKKGVKFADGDPVTAEAVKNSLEYCRTVPTNQSQALSDVTTIEAKDPHTVVIKLKAPNPVFELVMSQTQGVGQIISPKGLADPAKLTVDNNSAGAGAYIYQAKESVAGSQYTYTANPEYHDKSRQHYKKVVLKVIANPQAALNALTTKQVDMAVGDFTSSKQAKAAGLQVAWTPFGPPV